VMLTVSMMLLRPDVQGFAVPVRSRCYRTRHPTLVPVAG